jgi:hypothetical protein
MKTFHGERSLPVTKLRRDDAADYIRKKSGAPCSPKWLAQLASKGGGPPYEKFGRFPIYCTDDLDQWINSRTTRPLRA